MMFVMFVEREELTPAFSPAWCDGSASSAQSRCVWAAFLLIPRLHVRCVKCWSAVGCLHGTHDIVLHWFFWSVSRWTRATRKTRINATKALPAAKRARFACVCRLLSEL